MADHSMRGLHKRKDPKTGKPWPMWFVRREVPTDVRERIGKSLFFQTTGTSHEADAKIVRDRLWREWDAQIAEARALGDGPVVTLENALSAIEAWRWRRCRIASGVAGVEEMARAGVAALFPGADLGVGGIARYTTDDYFTLPSNAFKSREVQTSPAVQMLIGRLVAITSRPADWSRVDGFDDLLDAALVEGGALGAIAPSVRSAVRPAFAKALLEVTEHEEAERRRAAMLILSRAPANTLRMEGEAGFVVRLGDKTVAEVIASYRKERDQADTEKQYGHIFKCLLELIGPDVPIWAVGREEILEIRRLLYALPAHATKRFKDKPFLEVIQMTEDEDKPKLSTNTVRSYMKNLNAVFNYAKNVLRQMDFNPVTGLIPGKDDSVSRRAFTREEQDLVFTGLEPQRTGDSAHYWVPAILAFSGARANEIAQLRSSDIKTAKGIPYIDLGKFDDNGRRIDDRQVKTGASFRAIPIHAELVAGGFLDFVARRRKEGAERLFPELSPNVFNNYAHEISRKFGIHLDRIGLTTPALVLHSFRHQLRTFGRRARLHPSEIDAIGGWKSPGIGAAYGDDRSVEMIELNAANLSLIDFGGFKLATTNLPTQPKTLASM
ncbi:MAG: tyrosine-type recombinase/integrase [Alphaproteobacteria bacterium]|nr:tyrosine-type recombinase/integrase [Alphaproteobacteria bacterium]MBU1525352.1 tyrosine-type recombinase/integrase [Alphaproteobacteria bacterium]MBU2118703.1 tyrosine-type recombinase/integrase [Alphaproteobacteria bacterium]MBU2352496.1 tyrosine-type recombinase/integrase [Alphaproteobacteria bacterium]MBU2382417.1 tyrosine-type recombinase/integrase [Alphaproteobacteria bacterium]